MIYGYEKKGYRGDLVYPMHPVQEEDTNNIIAVYIVGNKRIPLAYMTYESEEECHKECDTYNSYYGWTKEEVEDIFIKSMTEQYPEKNSRLKEEKNIMKAKELIENGLLTNIDIPDGQLVVFKEVALAAINMAREEVRQNPWRNFKNERPKPNSHILRKKIHSDYQACGKTIYYADFWGEDRPDKWEQTDDRIIYEWQYINE